MTDKTKIQVENFEDYEQAESYIEAVRSEYRAGNINYNGRRNEDQQLIAEITSDEARLVVDQTFLGVMAIRNTMGLGESAITEIDEESENDEIMGGHSWAKYRSEFERLLVGFAVMTEKYESKTPGIVGYANMRAQDRMRIASALFYDYQRHNALRFGVDTAGVKATDFKITHTEDGEVERHKVTYDKDKAKSDRKIESNMEDLGFTDGVSTHQAGKISPTEYIKLRQAYPEIKKDRFDRDVNYYKNIISELENRG